MVTPLEGSKRRTRRILLMVGLPLGVALSILASLSWSIAGKPADQSTGLVAQASLLLGVFQALLALTVAMSTIYYALRTNDLVEATHASASNAEQATLRLAVQRLAEDAIAAAVTCGFVAGLMRKDWRWYLPTRSKARNQILQQQLPQAMTEIKETLRASESLVALQPSMKATASRLSDAVNQAFTAATSGQTQEVDRLAREVRQCSVTLRAEIGLEQQSSGLPAGSAGTPTA